jgi:hypothetical protein
MTVGDIKFKLPWERDKWLMRVFEELGFNKSECCLLNMVHLHQQVLYESDIFHADGLTINEIYFNPQKIGENWSHYHFGHQQPPPGAYNLWCHALENLAPGGPRLQMLRKYGSYYVALAV